MASSQAVDVGTQLDAHHAPETNGRMSVCRRCGTQTEGPGGLHHVPHERQLDRSQRWLITEARMTSIDRARELRAP
jgi:hypothetical protein